jgi:flagellar P-ring protein FlgI
MRTFLLSMLSMLLLACPAHAERVKDMGQFQGVRSNQLTGYGVVVGLAGTGDDSLDYATQGVKGALASACPPASIRH